MSGLLDGLGEMGLKNLEGMDLYEKPGAKEAKEAEKKQAAAAPVIKETDFLFDKGFDCPVCGRKLKVRTLRSGRARVVRTDTDLRPVYENIEPLKYDPVVCPGCGYSALARFFPTITQTQVKEIQEKISKAFQANIAEQETYSYEEALYRYKLCLANAIVKNAKASEKAYICLKTGWLLRSWQESLSAEDTPEIQKKCEELKEQEVEFLKKALEGFLSARQTEDYPMCGMDEITLEFLVSVLAMDYGQLDTASKLISMVITSPAANSRMKDKARDIKDMILAKMKENK
ncbi:MAG: DUF2225 domain-containing protein [Lachnospiraceae bacterium]|nr:DUF2225 domain-containing protein [Lachnospiraceae bacterium]